MICFAITVSWYVLLSGLFFTLYSNMVLSWLIFFSLFSCINEATKCKGYDQNQFPEGGLFVSASDGLWDNGAACGRRYRLRCISGLRRPCKEGSIVVQVVDFCQHRPCPATMVLSNKAFDAISRIPSAKINIEYAQ